MHVSHTDTSSITHPTSFIGRNIMLSSYGGELSCPLMDLAFTMRSLLSWFVLGVWMLMLILWGATFSSIPVSAAPCTSTTCTNGGTCLTTGYCQCPLGYMGADCSTSKNVEVFPFSVGTYGSGWMEFVYNNGSVTQTAPYVQVRWTVPTINYFGAILDVGWDGMTSGDTWVILVSSSGPSSLDFYSSGRNTPDQDSSQDLHVVSGWSGKFPSSSSSNTIYQSVEFTRNLVTSDSKDYVISSQPGHPIRFMWAVMNGNSMGSNGKGGGSKLPMHNYIGSIGQFKIDFITGQTWDLSDGVYWPQGYYDVAAITLIVLCLAALTQRQFIKKSVIGRLTHRPVVSPSYIPSSLKESSICHKITFDLIPSFLKLSANGLFIVAAYLALVVLMITSSQHDYADVGRSSMYVLGHLTSIHLALAILPVTKNSIFLPLFGIGYDTAIKWHRRVGRMAIFWMILHGVSQVVIWNPVVAFYIANCQYGYGALFGTLSLVCFLVLLFSSLETCRRSNYTRFYNLHIIFVAIGYVFALLHSINFRWLLIIPGFLWLIDVTLRFFNAYIRYPIKILNYQFYTLRNSPQDSLVALTLQSNIKDIQWGDYVYVNAPEISSTQWHPFSISSYRSGAPSQFTLHILSSRSKEDSTSFTTKLFDMTRTSKQNDPEGNIPNYRIKIHGPYRSHHHMLMSLKVVVLIAGGVGVTPCASALQHYLTLLQHNRQADKQGQPKKPIPSSLTLIWTACSDSPFIQWFPELMYQTYVEDTIQQQRQVASPSQVQVPISSPSSASATTHTLPQLSISLYNSQRALAPVGHRPRAASESQTGILVTPQPPSSHVELVDLQDERQHIQQQQHFLNHIIPNKIHAGRPNITNILSQLSVDVKGMGLSHNDVGVMVCGPPGMIQETQQCVVDCGFHFITEEFLL